MSLMPVMAMAMTMKNDDDDDDDDEDDKISRHFLRLNKGWLT